MGGCRSACRRRLLSAAVGRRSRHPALVFHDGGSADRRHGRPSRRDFPHSGGRRDDRAFDRARGAGASELPDVEIGGYSLPLLRSKPFDALRVFANQLSHGRERKRPKTRQIPGIGGENHRGNHRGELFCSRDVPGPGRSYGTSPFLLPPIPYGRFKKKPRLKRFPHTDRSRQWRRKADT
jgi:hypothetical protein